MVVFVGATWLLDCAKTFNGCWPLRSWLASEVELLCEPHLRLLVHGDTVSLLLLLGLLPLIRRIAITMAPVSFWTTPFQYIHWASRAKPAIFWSIIVGSTGPIMVVWLRGIALEDRKKLI